MLNGLRYAWRLVRNSPTAYLVAVMTLANASGRIRLVLSVVAADWVNQPSFARFARVSRIMLADQ
jgi:hypothetical protein